MWFLLTVMLNHAFVACDSVVVHLPAEHHNLIAAGAAHQHQEAHPHQAMHQHQADQGAHANAAVDDADDPHEPHAHVLCFVAYETGSPAATALHTKILLPAAEAFSITYAPAVPPPNA